MGKRPRTGPGNTNALVVAGGTPPPSAELIRGSRAEREALLARGLSPTTRLRPHIGRLLGTAYVVLDAEMTRMAEGVVEGHSLEPDEARKLHSYVDSICKLAREEREQERRESVDGLSDEELHAKLEDALAYLGDGSK